MARQLGWAARAGEGRPLGAAADVDAAVAAAVSAFPAYSQTRKSERMDLLRSLMTATESRFEDLAQAMRMEMGAPISMAREAQADAAIGHLQGFMDALAALVDRAVLSNGDLLLHEEIGLCGFITPWNWPITQTALNVIPPLTPG